MIQHPASCLCSLSWSLTGRQLLPPRPGPEPFITSCANTCWHGPRIKDTTAKKVLPREDQRCIDGRMFFPLSSNVVLCGGPGATSLTQAERFQPVRSSNMLDA